MKNYKKIVLTFLAIAALSLLECAFKNIKFSWDVTKTSDEKNTLNDIKSGKGLPPININY